jgi:glycosyltransferase involved in cell wall biosynthesis
LIPLVVSKKEWDLLISHNTYSSFTSFVLAKLKGIPYLYAVHDPIYYILNKVYVSEENRLSAKLLLPIAKYLDKVLAVGSKGIIYFGKVHQDYLEGLVNQKLVKRIPEGTVIAKEPPQVSQKQDYFLTVSSWKPGKKLEDLVELIKEIPDLKLKIIGSWVNSDYYSKIARLVEAEDLSNRVNIINRYLSDEELAGYYRQARALIIINPEAGFGRPIVEAAGQGTPAIAPSVCGATELFNHKEEGLFFNNLDQAINYIKMSMNKERAFDMGIKAWNRVKNRYSWESHNKMLAKIIYQL